MGSDVSNAEVLLDINEAQRRCLAAGYSLEMQARHLTSFQPYDARPLWQAHYLREVRAELQRADPPSTGVE
jgi:hypothetical protein